MQLTTFTKTQMKNGCRCLTLPHSVPYFAIWRAVSLTASLTSDGSMSFGNRPTKTPNSLGELPVLLVMNGAVSIVTCALLTRTALTHKHAEFAQNLTLGVEVP